SSPLQSLTPTKQVSTLTVGAANVNVFIGANGPASNPGAIGLSISNASFGLALLKPTLATDHSSYYGLKATAAGVSLVGGDINSIMDLSVNGLSIEVNGGTDTTVPGRVVDFTKISTDGGQTYSVMSIPTGGQDPVTLDHYTSTLLQASTDDALLELAGGDV